MIVCGDPAPRGSKSTAPFMSDPKVGGQESIVGPNGTQEDMMKFEADQQAREKRKKQEEEDFKNAREKAENKKKEKEAAEKAAWQKKNSEFLAAQDLAKEHLGDAFKKMKGMAEPPDGLDDGETRFINDFIFAFSNDERCGYLKQYMDEEGKNMKLMTGILVLSFDEILKLWKEYQLVGIDSIGKKPTHMNKGKDDVAALGRKINASDAYTRYLRAKRKLEDVYTNNQLGSPRDMPTFVNGFIDTFIMDDDYVECDDPTACLKKFKDEHNKDTSFVDAFEQLDDEDILNYAQENDLLNIDKFNKVIWTTKEKKVEEPEQSKGRKKVEKVERKSIFADTEYDVKDAFAWEADVDATAEQLQKQLDKAIEEKNSFNTVNYKSTLIAYLNNQRKQAEEKLNAFKDKNPGDTEYLPDMEEFLERLRQKVEVAKAWTNMTPDPLKRIEAIVEETKRIIANADYEIVIDKQSRLQDYLRDQRHKAESYELYLQKMKQYAPNDSTLQKRLEMVQEIKNWLENETAPEVPSTNGATFTVGRTHYRKPKDKAHFRNPGRSGRW